MLAFEHHEVVLVFDLFLVLLPLCTAKVSFPSKLLEKTKFFLNTGTFFSIYKLMVLDYSFFLVKRTTIVFVGLSDFFCTRSLLFLVSPKEKTLEYLPYTIILRSSVVPISNANFLSRSTDIVLGREILEGILFSLLPLSCFLQNLIVLIILLLVRKIR